MSTTSDPISSISALLSLSDSQYRIYDIGRRVDKISTEQFEKIEAAQLPYPYPSQGHALLAIAFWQKQASSPYLWFVKLPLDERGLLNQGARNHFIAIIIEALGKDLSVNPSEQQDALLKKNPYHFTPAQYKLAAINSTVSTSLKYPASKFYLPVQQYLSGKNGWGNWQDIGVQGLSDFAFRLSENNNINILANAIAFLPAQVLLPLCSALENIVLPAKIIEQITARFIKTDITSDLNITIALLRALASSTDHPFCQKLLTNLMTNKTLDEEILIIIAGRLWPILSTEKMLFIYLEHLIQNHDNELFSAIFKDLVAIPTIRPVLLQAIRSPQRSPDLAQAIGMLFK
ncbi:DUF3549 family protein [Colwellia sp. M166]|uniref:DUF3549 family protein n=1 Tax=Colwellia sp. M166 TaxID=2583805 RepID=UPI00211E9891|nr:DUF3549 family protein [Colwellia sp. M166]UUO21850.1 DUF3549 family protein [Colwellia sp. M166]|tara:strand:+ start:41283 stop:42320 length:1038 start_codon:yes stop_codon:yes gene_type:complete